MPDLLSELTRRGMVHDATPTLAARLAQGPITGYVGFDPTADSLHVGNLVPVMGLAWLQRLGGTPIALVGGGTGLVGDPSGKRSERPILSVEQIDANAASIGRQLHQFLDFEGPRPARLVNNAAWLRGLSLLDFLRDAGKHFTINYMLQKDSVKSRMDTGISFTEFAYMVVQAFDFDHLFRTAGCELQMGGSDQWGNITAGIELIGRRESAEAQGLVFPLLTTASGAKFGKSEEGNIWLDPAKTSPYRFYQYWVNVDDRDLVRVLRVFTFLPNEHIDALVRAHEADPGKRAAQRLLASDVTARVHGGDVVRRVEAASRILFGDTKLREADGATLAVVAGEVPVWTRLESEVTTGFTAIDALVATGLASSKSDARRAIQGGGISVNGEKVGDLDHALGAADLLAGRYIVLQKGRRNFAMVAQT